MSGRARWQMLILISQTPAWPRGQIGPSFRLVDKDVCLFVLWTGSQAVCHCHRPNLQTELHCCRWPENQQDENHWNHHSHDRMYLLFSSLLWTMKLLDFKLTPVSSLLSRQTRQRMWYVHLQKFCFFTWTVLHTLLHALVCHRGGLGFLKLRAEQGD